MKRAITTATAILMGSSMLVAPAFAQTNTDATDGVQTEASPSQTDSSGSVGGSVETEASPSQVDPETTAAVGGEANFDNAMSSMAANAESASAISTMSEVNDIRVVPVTELEGYDEAALDEAIEGSGGSEAELQSAVQANPELSSQVEAQGVEISSVVAADVGADGSLVLYVR